MRIEFKDYGQDFLWWEIDQRGKVIDCGPFQASVWCGKYVFDPKGLTVGGKVHFSNEASDPTNQEQEFKTISYPIENIVK